MINVNQITSQLARLPDAALQQYAAMHKNDPYTMALASAESNRRKQMRSGAQGTAQQQPTVADQEISGMNTAPQPQAAPQGVAQGLPQGGALPEEQGIGALPTPNMQGMADGGIVGYAEGGKPTTYNPASQWALHPFSGYGTDSGEGTSSTVGNWIDTLREKLGYSPAEVEARRAKGEAESSRMVDLQNQLRRVDPGLFEQLTAAQRAERQAAAEAIKAPLYETPAAQQSQVFPTSVVPQAAPGATAPATRPATGQFVDARTAAPGAARAKPPRTAVTGPSAPAVKSEGLESIYAKLEKLGGDKETKQSIKGYQDEVDASIAALKQAREEGKPQGEAYAAYKESLDKDAAAAQGKEDKNLKMALINAGLAMMGGKSQYAMQNIAEGAQVGTKQYQAGLDKLEEAAKARQKEIAMIEQARHSEARGDWKDSSEFNQKANEAKLASKKFGITALAEINGLTRKEAATMYGKQQELVQHEREHRETMASQEKIAGMYANARAGAAGTKGEITPALAFKNYTVEKANAERMGQGDQFNLKYPTKDVYIAEAMQAATPGAAGAAAPVDTTGFKVLR